MDRKLIERQLDEICRRSREADRRGDKEEAKRLARKASELAERLHH